MNGLTIYNILTRKREKLLVFSKVGAQSPVLDHSCGERVLESVRRKTLDRLSVSFGDSYHAKLKRMPKPRERRRESSTDDWARRSSRGCGGAAVWWI